MKMTKKNTQTAAGALGWRVARAVRLQQQIDVAGAELKTLAAAIKQSMQDAALTRFATAEGCEALLIVQTVLSWDTEKLLAVLAPEQYAALCPPTPKGDKLRAWLEAAAPEQAKALRACARGSLRTNLELRAPAEMRGEG